MTIYSLERPETTPELIGWLERHLVGDTLGELVAELLAVADPDQIDPPLEELIGSLDQVLNQGLKPLTDDQLRNLFRHPKRMLDLQEKIYIDGGDYWEKVPRPTELIDNSERLWKVLQSSIAVQSAPSQPSAKQPSTKRSSRPWILSLAALIVVGLITNWLMPHANTSGIAWTAETFRPSANREEFFTRLIDPPKRWLNQNPTTPEQLATKLSAFRQGCQELIRHEDGIPEQDRKWLVPACHKWSQRLDELMAEVKDLSKPNSDHSFEQIRADADALIHKLITRIETESKA